MKRNRLRTPRRTGTISLQTASQVALWQLELVGQISDGLWEGARPMGHFEFWCQLEVKLDPYAALRVETSCPSAITKSSYAFGRLKKEAPDVWARMVSLGRLATAAHIIGHPMEYEQALAAEDMPPALDSYLERLAATPAAHERFLKAVPQQLANLYYVHCGWYDERRLSKDVAAIKAAMSNVVYLTAP